MTRMILAMTSLLLAQVSVTQALPPNFVLILTDDQGWTSTSVQLDPNEPDSVSDFYQTVRLEELASQGMRFSNAYSSAPVCSPTRVSIQTGKSAARLQLTDITAGGDLANPQLRFLNYYTGEALSPPLPRTRLPWAEVTIAERLKQANPNYVTAHFGKWHMDLAGTTAEAFVQGYDYAGWGPVVPGENPKNIDRLTNVVDGFLEQQAATGQPFFLQISHVAVHVPIEARAATIKEYEALPGGVRHDSSDAEFAAMVDDLDGGIGTLMDKLVELGLDDNTYVFFVSDNGGRTAPGNGNNLPLTDAKATLHEGGIRVPMIIKGPGIQAGSHCGVPVVTHDLFTTISALAGATAPLPDGVEGGDLSPILFNGGELPQGMDAIERPQGANGELFFHLPHYMNGGSALVWGVTPCSAIRDGDFKLIKRYAYDGSPEQIFLYNLAQNLAESYDPDSPLNLADEMPAKVAELNGKLEAWLDAVDASQAYDVSENIELTWDAGSTGATSSGWRSVENVDYLFREQWDLDVSSPPTLVSSDTPSGLANKAYRFDGTESMSRKFFHVSEISLPDVFDNDHSASFEFWIKTDVLNQEQVLFESGDGAAGLSITFGDGDGDGGHDEIRLRILGDDLNELTVTSTLDTSITQGFVQLVAVFSDDPADRYAELFFNGVSLDRIEGINGIDEIDWDLLNPASLGLAGGFNVGGNGGPGDLPFVSGGFVGEVAMFRFNNFAIDGIEVLSRFDEIMALCPWDCGVADGNVGIVDFLALLAQWGGPGTCDFDGGGVGISDFLALLAEWGPCQ